ncbi:replication protein RepB [Streptomyces sp. CS090A]|nr:replication protein RepB [Streptomyces sp. CS090A]
MSQGPRRERRTATARELADRFGVSERTVQRMIAEERTAYEGRSRERRDQIVELHRQGLRGYEIARELNVSSGLVSTRLKEARAAGVDLTRYAVAGEPSGQGRA